MSAAGHWAILRFWDQYERDLKQGLQRFRWTEYQLSASLIMTLLFASWSFNDAIQASGCFMISAMCIQFGDCHEILNSGKPRDQVRWKSFWYGAIFGMIPWIIMYYYIYRIIVKYNIPLDLFPWWVWAFFVEYWLLFWCFPITLVLQYR